MTSCALKRERERAIYLSISGGTSLARRIRAARWLARHVRPIDASKLSLMLLIRLVFASGSSFALSEDPSVESHARLFSNVAAVAAAAAKTNLPQPRRRL